MSYLGISRAFLATVMALTLLLAACGSGNAVDSSTKADPDDSVASADLGAFAALTRSATEGSNFEVFSTVNDFVEGLEIVVVGEIVEVDEGRTFNSDEAEFFHRENVMFTVRVTEVLSGDDNVKAGDDILVEWPRPNDLSTGESGDSGPIPAVPVAKYSETLPPGLRVLIGANDFTNLSEETSVSFNVTEHAEERIYSPHPQGFVAAGAEGEAFYVGSLIPTPSDTDDEGVSAPQPFDKLIETVRQAGQDQAAES